MATREDVFPSKYLKAEDLKGKPVTVEIVQANLENLKNANGESQSKVVLYFQKTKKMLPLNRVNFDSVADIAGADSDDWAGARIELYPTKTQLGGKIVDCIRVRPPRDQRVISQAAQPPAPSAPSAPSAPPPAEPPPRNVEFDDDIPF